MVFLKINPTENETNHNIKFKSKRTFLWRSVYGRPKEKNCVHTRIQ